MSRRLSVRRKLETLLAAVVGLPLMAAGLGGVLATQKYLRRQAHLTLAAELAHLDDQVRSLYAALRTDAAVARAFVWTSDPLGPGVARQLQTFAAVRPLYGTVSLLGAEGQTLAHVEHPPWRSPESPYYATVAQELSENAVAVLPVELAGTGAAEVRPTLAVITRLESPAGRPARAIVLEMDADTLFAIFRGASGSLGGTLAVVSGDGYFLYRSHELGAAQAPDSSGAAPSLAIDFPDGRGQAILSGDAGELTLGDRMVLYRPVGPSAAAPEYRLIAYREVSRRELLAPARRLGWLMGGGLVLMLMLTLTAANLTARHFTRPILLLRDATRRVAQGSWEKPLVVKTDDELEDLARDFGVMAEEVRARRASLETLVAELTTAKETLGRSEAGYRSLIESAPYGICRVTLGGRFQDVNPALVAILRRESAAEILALDIGRDVFASGGAWAEVVAQFQEIGRIDGTDLEWRRADGQPVFVRVSGRRLPPQPEEPDSVELIAEDITERRGLEFQLRQAQKLEAVGQLAGGMAHDFNNLLTTVLANAELLRAELPAGVAESEDLQSIRLAAERGAALIRKLMAFTRQQPLDFQTVRLRELVAEFARMLRRMVREDVAIEVSTDANEPSVRADRSALEQILLNLMTNSRDAMPAGGTIRVRTGHATLDAGFVARHGWGIPGEYGTLIVADTGHGMDADTLRRVFEPFFTTKPVGSGTGLGLAIVYGLVKQHSGYVDVASQAGTGTTVTVYLPAVPERRAHPAAAVVGGALPRGAETILLVEDEPSLRRTGKRVLEKHGYSVLLACDGVEALEVIRVNEQTIDLVVSDVVMPRMGGPQLEAKLREAGYMVKVLFTSGYTARDVRDAIRLEPGLPFLPKPWTISDLLQRVREVLDS